MNGLYHGFCSVHILAAMVWVGGAVLLGVLAVRASRDADPGAVGRFVSGMRVVGPRVLAPATIAVVGLGVWMVLHSAAWDFGQFWVQLCARVLFAGAFVIGAAHQSRAAIGAERAADRGDDDEARRQLTRWSWGYWAIVALLVVATWDMTTQPGSEPMMAPTPEAIHEQMADAFNRADVEAFVDLHEEGAITIPPHRRGR